MSPNLTRLVQGVPRRLDPDAWQILRRVQEAGVPEWHEVWAHRLARAGVPVSARRFPGMIHGFVAQPTPIPAGDRAIALIAHEANRAWRTRGPAVAGQGASAAVEG